MNTAEVRLPERPAWVTNLTVVFADATVLQDQLHGGTTLQVLERVRDIVRASYDRRQGRFPNPAHYAIVAFLWEDRSFVVEFTREVGGTVLDEIQGYIDVCTEAGQPAR